MDKVEQRKRAAENWAVRSRNYRRARERALTALARNHKEEYLEILALEKEKDEQEGKRWSNLAGADVPLDPSDPAYRTGEARRNSPTNPQNKGDNE